MSRQFLIDLIWQDEPSKRRRHSLNQLLYSLRKQLPEIAVQDAGGSLQISELLSDRLILLESGDATEVAAIFSRGNYLESVDVKDNDTLLEWRDHIASRCKQHLHKLGNRALTRLASEHKWRDVSTVARVLLGVSPYEPVFWDFRLRGLTGEGDIAGARGEAASLRVLYANDLGVPLPPELERVVNLVGSMSTSRAHNPQAPRALRFVGRTMELREICGTLQSAMQQRQGALIFVSGPGGIGKTSLVERALRSMSVSGIEFYAITCSQRSRLSPFHALSQTVRSVARTHLTRLDPEWREVLEGLGETRSDPDSPPLFHEPAAVYEASCRLLKANLAEGTPLVVWIDDAQWLDSASAAGFAYMMSRLANDCLCWIISARYGGASEAERLFTTWERIQRRPRLDIRLAGLSLDDVRTAAASDDGASPPALHAAGVESAYAFSGGNPLLLNLWFAERNWLRPGSAAAEFPAGSAESAVSEALAVLGGVAGLTVIQEVTQLSRERVHEAIEHLAARGIVSATSVTVSLVHDLVRERILARMSAEEQGRLNARAVAALRGIERRSAARLAHHALQADDDASACRYALEAADECLLSGAYGEAEYFLDAALARSTRVAENAAALTRLGFLYLDRERLKEAKLCFDQVADAGADPDVAQARNYLDLTSELCALVAPADDVAARALECVNGLRNSRHRDLWARAICTAIEAAHDAGRIALAMSVVQYVGDTWSTHDEPRIRAYLAGVSARLLGLHGELRRARTWARLALQAAEETRDPLVLSRSWATAGTVHTLSGQIQRAVDDFRRAESYTLTPAGFPYRQRILNNFGVALIEADRVAEARSRFVEALAGAHGHDLLFLLGNLAWTELLLGRVDEATRHAEAMRAMNAVFRAAWAEHYAGAILALLHPDSAEHTTALGAESLCHHGLHQLLLRQCSTRRIHDAAAVRRTVEQHARTMRGRDLLARVRLHVVMAMLAGRPARMDRIARWARARGAHLLAREIDEVMGMRVGG